MTDWVAFAGRLHPVVLHLPIGLVAGLVLIEIASMFSKATALRGLRAVFLWATVASAAAAAATGWLLGEQGYSGATLGWHRWLGISMAGALLVMAIFDLAGRAGFRRLMLVIVLGLMTVTGHLGGTMTHGEGFLGAYAPAWARPILGAPAVAPPSGGGEASIIIATLADRCYKCHGSSTQKGGLRLDDADGLMSVVEAGDAPGSELFRRITLAAGDADRMPPEGEGVSDEAIVAILHWINGGAALEKIRQAQDDAAAVSEAAGAQLEAVRARTGALVLPIEGENEGLLRVDFARRLSVPGVEDVAALAEVADRIVELSFAGQAIDDSVVTALPVMPALERLHLERTGIADAALVGIAETAPNVAYLNLHSTQVTGASLEEIGRIGSLRSLFLYATDVDAGAVAAFEAAHPDVEVTMGLSLPDP